MDLTILEFFSDPNAFDAAAVVLTWCVALASVPVGIGVALQVLVAD